jgi:chromosome segregation ATPase
MNSELMAEITEKMDRNAELRKAAAEKRFVDIAQTAVTSMKLSSTDIRGIADELANVLQTVGKTREQFQGYVTDLSKVAECRAKLPGLEEKQTAAMAEVTTLREQFKSCEAECIEIYITRLHPNAPNKCPDAEVKAVRAQYDELEDRKKRLGTQLQQAAALWDRLSMSLNDLRGDIDRIEKRLAGFFAPPPPAVMPVAAGRPHSFVSNIPGLAELSSLLR